MKSIISIVLPLAWLLPAAAIAFDPLAAFPAAGSGMSRHVLRLPEVPDAETLRVEIIAGRTIMADCNRQHFVASFSEETVDGWGYPRYIVSSLRGPVGTMMACPPEQATALRFVGTDFGGAALLRYNTRLPLVIYAPDDVELRYRIWRGGEVTEIPAE